MRILKLGKEIGQTVKNVTRLKTILTVMGKHGLASVIERFELVKLIPGVFRPPVSPEKEALTLPERFRCVFEELGPTFIKLGQVLSTRPDLIPEDYAEEFKKLQDHVRVDDYEVVEKTLKMELKRPLEKIFKFISKEPLAAASIAQVHEAELLDGTKVVLKVQRPHIEDVIEMDVSILYIVAKFIEKYFEESVTFNPVGVVDEFFKTLRKELDFVVEAGNMMRIRKNFEGNANVVIPLVYRQWTTPRVLTLEKLEGIRLSDIKLIREQRVDVKKFTHVGVQAFYKMILVDGLFHGDLHAGNIFVLAGGKIGLIDFGIVGRLNQRTRDAIGDMFLALVSEDYDALVREYCEIGIPMGKVDMEGFSKQVRELVEPFFGLPLKDINVGKMLMDLSVIASQHRLRMSQDLMLVFKAIVTVEGMGRSIDPDFDILKEMTDFSQTLFKARYNPERISKDIMYALRDTKEFLQVLPRQLRQWMKKISNDEWIVRVRIEELKAYQESQLRGQQLVSLAIILASLIGVSTATLLLEKGPTFFGFSLFGIMGFGMVLLLGFVYFISYFKK